MPNWCANKLYLSHDDKDMMDRFINAFNRTGTCNEFVPMPDGYIESGEWYNWSIDNWGTKWDIGANRGHLTTTKHGSVECNFLSAWSPPVGLYEKLDELGFRVTAVYFEPGIGFCGIWSDGEDECMNISNNDDIPNYIVKHFPEVIDMVS